MKQHAIEIPEEKLAEFCRRNHVVELSLFGSVLRDNFGRGSDVDVMVEFEPGHTIGLIRLALLEIELSEIIGRKVDLRTPQELSRYFREEIMNNAEPLYARK